MKFHILLIALAACLALAVAPACATDEHDYAKGEYAIIRDGLAPNKSHRRSQGRKIQRVIAGGTVLAMLW